MLRITATFLFKRKSKILLTDNENTKHWDIKKRPKNADKRKWSDTQKVEAVQTYMQLGTVKLTAQKLGISEHTVYYWQGTQWWKDIIRDIKAQERLLLTNRMRGIRDKSLDIVEERLQNGDFIYDQKTGKMKRKPMQAKDVHKIAIDMIKEQIEIEKQEEHILNQDSIEEKLEKLAKSFEQLANKNNLENIQVSDDIIDVEAIETPQPEQKEEPPNE